MCKYYTVDKECFGDTGTSKQPNSTKEEGRLPGRRMLAYCWRKCELMEPLWKKQYGASRKS